jgi:hypothetical protein
MWEDILAGKKTYLIAIGVVLYSVGALLTSEMSVQEAVNYWIVGGGMASFRAAMNG